MGLPLMGDGNYILLLYVILFAVETVCVFTGWYMCLEN